MNKKIRMGLKYILGILFLLLVIVIKPVDRTHFIESDYYKSAQLKLDSLKANTTFDTNSQLEIGWAKVNITPKIPTPLSGYGSRKGALSV